MVCRLTIYFLFWFWSSLITYRFYWLASLKKIIAWLLSFISYITFIACPRETVLNVVFALLIFYPGFSHVLHTQRTGGSPDHGPPTQQLTHKISWRQPGPRSADSVRQFLVNILKIIGDNPDHGLPSHYLFFILVLVVFNYI